MIRNRFNLNIKALIALFALLVLAQQLFTFPTETQLAVALNNFAHTPWFLSITLLIWLCISSVYPRSFRIQFIACCALAFGFCVILEVVQFFTSRDASLGDIARNCLGAVAALSLILAASHREGPRKYVVAFYLLLSVCAVSVAFANVGSVLWLHYKRAQNFPVLLEFSNGSNWSSRNISGNWHIEASSIGWSEDQPQIMAKILLSEGRRWPGLILREPFPTWSAYQILQISAFLDANAPLPLNVRVETFRDGGQDSTMEIHLQPGRNELAIPLSQVVPSIAEPATRIKAVHIFGDHSQIGRSFYLASMSLSSPIFPQ